MTLSNDEVHQVMMDMPDGWRYHWCESSWWTVVSKGVTKEQWEQWVAANPEPAIDPSMAWCNDWRTPPTPLTQLQQRLDAYKASK